MTEDKRLEEIRGYNKERFLIYCNGNSHNDMASEWIKLHDNAYLLSEIDRLKEDVNLANGGYDNLLHQESHRNKDLESNISSLESQLDNTRIMHNELSTENGRLKAENKELKEENKKWESRDVASGLELKIVTGQFSNKIKELEAKLKEAEFDIGSLADHASGSPLSNGINMEEALRETAAKLKSKE